MSATYAIGIDLGTTNSVVAVTRLDQDDERPPIEVLSVPQLTGVSTVEPRQALPSFLYLGTEAEAEQSAFALPWGAPAYAVGEWARQQAADVPMRTVAGAKSWLAHSRVDRREAILPWNAPDDVPAISPVEAASRYLQHLVAAWHAAHPDDPLAEQEVVLTVPASFDAAARELTREAAMNAGLPEATVLLEEPQAAFYAWLADQGRDWREHVSAGDVVLVCDVGGGTTDLSLIGVDDEDGEMVLRRLAVGNHILVGGDNMDLALAHVAQRALDEQGVQLDAWQSVSLWHACRTAKEALLTAEGPASHPVSVLGRGRRLIGGTVSADLSREQVADVLIEGFFPRVKADERPARRAASGFRELGLPFESDPAITRHLAAFLGQQADARPTHVLFNGGVFRADALRGRLLETLKDWYPDDDGVSPLIGNGDMDLAVARGAAYYARAKQGHGVRIRGGTPRTYYIGVETAGPAVPGTVRPLQQFCVVPMGMEEGTSIDVPGPEIGLITGEQATFRFFCSAVRHDEPGTMLTTWGQEELAETDSLSATLPAADGRSGDYAPVRFEACVTELGVLELWGVSTVSDDRWKLEFSVREAPE